MTFAIVVAVCSLPVEFVKNDRVDVIEVNHCYDENGHLVFNQVIFWDLWDQDSGFHVVAWRLVKRPAQFPYRDWKRGGYAAVWHDGELLRRVRAKAMRETWTQYDPELEDRQPVPTQYRRGLSKGRLSNSRLASDGVPRW